MFFGFIINIKQNNKNANHSFVAFCIVLYLCKLFTSLQIDTLQIAWLFVLSFRIQTNLTNHQRKLLERNRWNRNRWERRKEYRFRNAKLKESENIRNLRSAQKSILQRLDRWLCQQKSHTNRKGKHTEFQILNDRSQQRRRSAKFLPTQSRKRKTENEKQIWHSERILKNSGHPQRHRCRSRRWDRGEQCAFADSHRGWRENQLAGVTWHSQTRRHSNTDEDREKQKHKCKSVRKCSEWSSVSHSCDRFDCPSVIRVWFPQRQK